MTRHDVRLAALGALLLGSTLAALALHAPGSHEDFAAPGRLDLFVAFFAAAVAVYFLAVREVLRRSRGAPALWIVLAVAAAMRAPLLPSLPLLSTDVYRYVWDGRVQAAGINPYRYVPADPALVPLRDPDVYPWINRRDYAPTIYPPAAQVVFALVGRVSDGVTGMKVAMLGFEAVAVLCVLRLLAMAGLPRERVLIYAWNPLAAWSFALDGHVDAVAIGFLGLALLARARRHDGLGGALLAAAALVKFLPVAVAPAFARGGSLWRPAAAGASVVCILYGLYLSVGAQVLGYLSAYGNEERYDSGAGYWLLAGLSHLAPLPPSAGRAYALCVGLGFAALSLWIAFGRPAGEEPDPVRLCRDTAVLATLATAAASPHYPWYYAWLALPCAVAPVPAVIWLSAAPVLFYLDPWNEPFAWGSLVFVPAIVLALRGARRRAAPSAIVTA